MSGPSFTAAALSAMRANQPQLPASASVPRHTYSSSYARDYAELQSYQDYLQSHADSNAAARASERDAAARRSAAVVDADEQANYVGRSPHAASRNGYGDERGGGGVGGSARAYQPVRAPYAQDDADDAAREQRGNSSNSHNNGGGSTNPHRYRSTASSSYERPDTSVISTHLPLPPSKQPLPAAGVTPKAGPPRTPGDTPWASHDEPSSNSSRRPAGAAAVAVPALALNKVPAAAFDPYGASDRHPEPVITRAHDRDEYDSQPSERGWEREPQGRHAPERRDDDRDRRDAWQQPGDDDDDDDDAEYRYREAQRRRRQAEYEEEERRADAAQRDRRSAANDYDDRRDSRDSDAYDRRRADNGAEPQRGGRVADRYDDDYDREDEVSRPMGQMRVGGAGRDERRYDEDDRRDDADRYDQRYGREEADGRYQRHHHDDARRRADSRDRSHSPPQSRDRQSHSPDSYDDPRDDRGRSRYGSDHSPRQQPLRVGGAQHQMQESQRSSAPYANSYAEPTLSVRERQQQAARAEAAAHYGDVAAGRSSGLKPNAQNLRAHAPIFGPYAQAEPARPAKKSARQQFDAYVESRNREPQRRAGPVPVDPTAAGVRAANPYGHLSSGFSIAGDAAPSAAATAGQHSQRSHVHSGRGTGPLRNPILQNTPDFETKGGSHEFSQRRTKALGMHPSVESAQLEEQHPARRGSDLQVATGWQSRRDASSVGGVTPDRGVRIVSERSHRHSNIFGVASTAADLSSRPLHDGEGFDPPARGIRVTQQRNASSEVLAPQNLLYDRPSTSYADPHQRDLSHAGGPGWSSHRSLSHRDASAPVHRSPEQQAERDAYEQQLRRLHDERIDTERRAKEGQARGHTSARLW